MFMLAYDKGGLLGLVLLMLDTKKTTLTLCVFKNVVVLISVTFNLIVVVVFVLGFFFFF